ncbi:MAG TPA: hypothetical protein VFC38_07060 [Stellaceae bacterium]|nr:hypothetical protein [Stellaceae bacterium]
MNIVYAVWHLRNDPDGFRHDTRIGVYSSRRNAEAGIAKVRDQPGFKERPDGFRIEEMTIDQDYG